MLINTEWLAEFVELPASLDELCERLVAAGAQVDAVSNPSAAVSGVIVGEVHAVRPHPNAERLNICDVFDGEATSEVVCGAPNVAAGQKVAFARIGARLPGIEIVQRKIRGVESFGMLCGRSELGLEEKSAGIWELPASAVVGKPLFEQFPVAPVLTLSLTPNRPDLLSHIGVAREVAAATSKRMKAAKWRVVEKGPDVSGLARVIVEDPAGCRRYAVRVVRGLKIGPSPRWLRERLERVGQRSINNVVDATNYVMMEFGQPMHAFDIGRIAIEGSTPTIHVRRAEDGEKLRTLDGVVRVLTSADVIIADAEKPLALAGIMGGADSQVTDGTTTVLLESAYFDPMRVRRSAKHHGLRTESSYRFERGCDPGIVVKALDRCAQLLTEIADGEPAKGTVDVAQKSDNNREIMLRVPRVRRVLGVDLPTETVVQLLDSLEIRCSTRTESSLRFQAPTFRPDLTREIDLIEEIARRLGYDRIPERLPDASGDYSYDPVSSNMHQRLVQRLTENGVTEVINYGFGKPQIFDALAGVHGEPVRLLNPIGEELSALRTTLVPGLLSVLSYNQRHSTRDVRIFELGKVIQKRVPAPEEDERDRDLPAEEYRVAVLISGGRFDGRWYERGAQDDFSDLKGLVENIVSAYGLAQELSCVPFADQETPLSLGMNPLCSAELSVGGVRIGFAGQVSPASLQDYQAEGAVFVAELSLTKLALLPQKSVRHTAAPKFPGTRRDVAVIVDRKIAAESIRSFIQANAGGKMGPAVIEQVRLFDVYEGKPIPPDRISLAFAIDYRNRERTLTDAEVAEAFNGVLTKLKAAFPLEIRS